MGFDDVGVMLPVVVVEVFEEFLLADDFARMVKQVFEDVVLGGREVDEHASAMDGLLERIELDIESVEGGMGGSFATADEGLGAGEEFAEVEGFGEIVVRTGVEELDDSVLAFFCSEDENGGGIFAGAHAAEEAVAVELGEHEVENDEVVTEIGCSVVAGFTVRGPIDGKTGSVAEGGGEIVGKPNFVFNEQNAHGGSLHGEIMNGTRLNGAEARRQVVVFREELVVVKRFAERQ